MEHSRVTSRLEVHSSAKLKILAKLKGSDSYTADYFIPLIL